MKIVLVFAVVLFFTGLNLAKGADRHFKYIQPIDNFVTKHLAWEDTKTAAKYSDYVVTSLMIAPFVYGGLKKEDRVKRLTTAAGMFFVSTAFVSAVKQKAQRTRPNNENNYSFFSGHTSTAFTGAGLICMQEKGKGWCYPSLVLAATAGYFRIAAKKHYLSDVLVGAGIGYLNGRYFPKLIISF